MLRGRIEFPSFASRYLADNPLQDPVNREVLVYMPPSYGVDRRYPVLMVLPPYAAGHRSLTNYKVWEPDFFARYEALLGAGHVPEAIIVSPDCMTRWGGSQFINSEATGLYQTYIADEIIPWLDANYRTIPEREARAVVGRSSGGFGALRLGLDRPELFCAYGSHAGDCAFELSIRPALLQAAIHLEKVGGLVAFLGMLAEGGPKSGADFNLVMTLASAAAYAPNMDGSFPHVTLPFEPRTARLIPEVWTRWMAHDPCEMLEKDLDAFQDAALVFLDAGVYDEHGLQFGTRRMASLLESRQVNLIHEEFPGGHRGTAYRYENSMRALLPVLATDD